MIDKTITRQENYLPLQATNEVHFPHSHPPLYIFWDEKRHPPYSLLRQRIENRQDFSSLHRTISNLSLVKRNSYKMPYRTGIAFDRYKANVNVFVARNWAISGKFEYVERCYRGDLFCVTYRACNLKRVNFIYHLWSGHTLAILVDCKKNMFTTVKECYCFLQNWYPSWNSE